MGLILVTGSFFDQKRKIMTNPIPSTNAATKAPPSAETNRRDNDSSNETLQKALQSLGKFTIKPPFSSKKLREKITSQDPT